MVSPKADGPHSIALSTDHKPSDPAERARIVRCGGRVFQSRYGSQPFLVCMLPYSAGHALQVCASSSRAHARLDAERAHARTRNVQVCVFELLRATLRSQWGPLRRSIGDLIAKSCGVVAAPTHQRLTLTLLHRAIIVATDGIWDMLTNDETVKIVASAPDAASAAVCRRGT